MRNIIITVGAPGSGKSTWIKEQGLEEYTLSPDSFRLLLSAPTYSTHGRRGISQENDKQAWSMMDQVLEQRMQAGHFTVVDATHTREKYLRRYKKLADTYRYRMYVRRFDVPLEELIERNNKRDEFKRVPEEVIAMHVERLKTLSIGSMASEIQHVGETNEVITYHDHRGKPVYFIGDIHGVIEPLEAFLKEHGDEDATFVFLGDYIDRGKENAEVLKRLFALSEDKRFIFLEGNHERWLWMWANDRVENIRSREFILRTMPQLTGVIDKKDARMFYRKLRTFVSFETETRDVFACHGGVSHTHPSFISTDQLIGGVGKYEQVGEIYKNGMFTGRAALVHGHRNIQSYDTDATGDGHHFNLDGSVEFGGSLRVVKFDKTGYTTYQYENTSYVAPEVPDDKHDVVAANATNAKMIEYMRSSPYIRENVLGNISSFNFTRTAFLRKVWDGMTMRARGLFIDTNTNEIVARSYDKFFNLNENEQTSEFELAKKLVFPVTVYAKTNGFLGLIGFDHANNTTLYCSKSTTEGPFAENFRRIAESKGLSAERVSPWVTGGYTLVFEVVDPVRDPHIIKYDAEHIVLLDVVKNSFVYEKLPYDELVKVAESLGVPVKEKVTVLNEFHQVTAFIDDHKDDQHEGYVIEDHTGYQFKVKLNWYKKWKSMRSLKDRVHQQSFRISDYAFSQDTVAFLTWVKEAYSNEEVRARDIISLREEFYAKAGLGEKA